LTVFYSILWVLLQVGLNTDYNADHCSIIAFIYRESDLEIVQVEEAPIK